MLPILQLVKFTHKLGKSHSNLVDFQQIHIRNVFIFVFGLSVARQMFGEYIICLKDKQGLTQSFVDTVCYINGTFTPGDPPMYHNYYQWIPIYFLLSAFGFFFPFSLWSRRCGSFIKELTTNINNEADCRKLYNTIKRSDGNLLFWKTWALEMSYFILFILYLMLTNVFFNYGWSGSIPKMFPATGFCYYDYNTESGISTGRFICLLPLNSVYLKVFYALYGLAALLLLMNALTFVYRIVLFVRLGRKQVNVWWCSAIAIEAAETWILKDYLERVCKERVEPVDKYFEKLETEL